MLFRDILIHYVDVDAQRNPIKNTAVEKRATENQNIKKFMHHLYFYLYPELFLSFVNPLFDLKTSVLVYLLTLSFEIVSAFL